jgi:hypothetical protein
MYRLSKIKCIVYNGNMKYHAIDELSDQLMALTAGIQEIERRQEPYDIQQQK